jgi:hypothetical protein
MTRTYPVRIRDASSCRVVRPKSGKCKEKENKTFLSDAGPCTFELMAETGKLSIDMFEEGQARLLNTSTPMQTLGNVLTFGT